MKREKFLHQNTMNKEEEKKAVHSAKESGEIVKYSEEFFKQKGSKGGFNSWKPLTPEQKQKRLEKMWANNPKHKKISTD